MAILKFPEHSQADENGLIAIGGDLEPESLLLAYRNGIFPWPSNNRIVTWFSPPTRAILFFDQLKFSKSFLKFQKKTTYYCELNSDFEQIIKACSELKNRGLQGGTWITKSMISAYIRLHELGWVHSVGCYSEQKLIGGLYGVCINGFFAGESMFYRQPNASKVALYYLIDLLKEAGYTWLDCQVMTPFFESLGAIEIPREQFLELLKIQLEKKIYIKK